MISTIAERWEHGSFFHWTAPELTGPTPHPWNPANILCGSGRDALRALIEHGKAVRGWRRLYVPCYYCQDVVAALVSTGIEVTLYDDGPTDPVPDPGAIAFDPGDVVLRVNFFGLRGRLGSAAARPDVEVIDDFSHDPWCHDAWRGDADWAVVSLRKTLPLPDGGVLWSPRGHRLPRQPWLTRGHRLISLTKLAAMVLKSEYLQGKPVPKETYRRLAESSEVGLSQGDVSGMPPWTRRLFDCIPAAAWRDRRRENHRAFSDALADVPRLSVLQASNESETCPFAAIVITQTRELRDRVRAELISQNVYPAVLWPLDEPVLPDVPAKYVDLSRRMFAIQCDARYTPEESVHVAEMIRRCGNGFVGHRQEAPAVTLEVLTTLDTARWREVLERVAPYDFYHLPEFHRLAEQNGEGEAVMLVFEESGHTIAFPMLLRRIEGTTRPNAAGCYRDAGCIYGFGGPLASSRCIPMSIRRHFQEHLQDYFEERDIVSVFCRLHPLIAGATMLEGYGNIVETGTTVSMDLTVPPEEQVRRYRRNHRQDIERLRRLGYSCRQVGPEYLDRFTRVYLDTMDRVNADSVYYFSRSYFEQMMSELSDVAHLFACEAPDGTVASVALCAVCNGIIQVHLAGTADQHRRLAPMKLVFDTIRMWGNDIGAKIVHLGGGVNARKDSLYSFKTGFGGQEHVYHTWQHVVNREIYDRLCDQTGRPRQAASDVSYFPEYRSPGRRTSEPCPTEVTSNATPD